MSSCISTIRRRWNSCGSRAPGIGAVVVTTNTRSAGAELGYFADNCNAVAAITQPELAELVAQQRQAHQVARGHGASGRRRRAGCQSAPEQGELHSPSLDGDPADLPQLEPDPWRHGSVQYTSGTTSRPKGVLWTHGNALWGARHRPSHENLNENDIHLVMMPSFHTNARTYSILPTMWVGGTVVLMPKFSASRFWDIALRNRCTWARCCPSSSRRSRSSPIPKHHFRMFGMAANETPFDQVFGVRSIGWWGMTETVSQGIVGDALLRNRPMTTGRPAAGLRHSHAAAGSHAGCTRRDGPLECWGVARHPDVPRVSQQSRSDG